MGVYVGVGNSECQYVGVGRVGVYVGVGRVGVCRCQLGVYVGVGRGMLVFRCLQCV